MSEGEKISVLICGDVLGKFKTLFNKVAKLCEANKALVALYCVGSFFGEDNSQWDLVKSGKFKMPIPCYVLGPCKPEHVVYYPCLGGGEIAPNVIYLGNHGILSSVGGLKIAYLSGVDTMDEKSGGRHTFSVKDVVQLQNTFERSGLRGVDFFLTSQWPKDVTKHVPTPVQFENKTASRYTGILAVTLKPCYHFAGLEGVFMERPPYRNAKTSSNELSHLTRFIGLAAVSNSEGMQYMYGVNHCPLLYVSEKELMNEKSCELHTESPYRSQTSDDTSSPNLSHKRQVTMDHKMAKRSGQHKCTEKVLRKCWFCLNSTMETHLIITIGQYFYVGLAKGWITPDHLLIIPLTHCSSTPALKEDELKELNSYKYAIKEYFHSIEKDVVFFERNYKSSHLQIQVIAIPQNLNVSAEKTILKAAGEYNILLKEIPYNAVMKQVVGTKQYFFCIEMEFKGQRPKKYLHIIKDEFLMEFPRNVLASELILNVPDRINWRDCPSSKDYDRNLCQKLRKQLCSTLAVCHD